MAWPLITRNHFFYFSYTLLFLSCFFLLRRRFDHPSSTITIQTYKNTPNLIKIKNFPNTIKTPQKLTKENTTSKPKQYSLNCPSSKNPTKKCPRNNYPTTMEDQLGEKDNASSSSCPDYFRWIHEDLKPWKRRGITREMVEKGKRVAYFRLIILDGRVYVERYKKAFQSRDVYTIWGILQVLRLYPGKLGDIDLMFECNDYPVIKKSDYEGEGEGEGDGDAPAPMFHYCGDDQHFDIPFPDWSFWGWHEINIKPWELQLEDIEEGNKKVKWKDRVPNAYWKGNTQMGNRISLSRCNSTKWNTNIYQQHWILEGKNGYKHSNLADQCSHRYKIYMEGKTWSVSEKYIQACDSMLLLVEPRYYEFFSRSLLPLTHYWPINPSSLCPSIHFAVNWGNKHPLQAEEIGKAGSKFIKEDLKMKYIYDYMFHLLNEYGKLLQYKPSVPAGAVEVCSETMACNAFGNDKIWKLSSLVKAPSLTSPCSIPPPFVATHLHKFITTKQELFRDVEGLRRVGF